MLYLRHWCAPTRLVLLTMAAQSFIGVRVISIAVCKWQLTQAPPGSNDYEYFMNVTKLPDLAKPALENLFLVGFPIVTAVRLFCLTIDYFQLDGLAASSQFYNP